MRSIKTSSALLILGCIVLTGQAFSKTRIRELSPRIALRPVVYRNAAYSSSGKYFAIPNFVTAGSVGVFAVSKSGEIAKMPSRFSENDFMRSGSVFYYASRIGSEPDMVFIPLPELLSGYSVSFSPQGEHDTLAIAGKDRILMYCADKWKLTKTIVVAENTTRAIFSPSDSRITAVANGTIYCIDRVTGSVAYTIAPEGDLLFADVAYSSDGKLLAGFEYQGGGLDHNFRIRIFEADDGSEEKRLPVFEARLGNRAAMRFPLVSFLPGDSTLAVTVERTFSSRIFLARIADGSILREFKGISHALSPDRSVLFAGGTLFDTGTWDELGKIPGSPRVAEFSPVERVLITLTDESLRRFRIEH